jgi:hypothetical protein
VGATGRDPVSGLEVNGGFAVPAGGVAVIQERV